MDQKDSNKINRLSNMNNLDLRSNRLHIEKIRQSSYFQPTVNDGVVNRFGFKHVVTQRTSKENKQPSADESKIKLQKKYKSTRPTFKVGIPHHKYWSPTAKDTPISHFHGLDKRLKPRRTFLKRLNRAAIIENINQEQPVACTNMNDLEQEKTTQEILKKENPIDEFKDKETDIMESDFDALNVDTFNSDESNILKDFFIIVIIIILYYYILSFFK